MSICLRVCCLSTCLSVLLVVLLIGQNSVLGKSRRSDHEADESETAKVRLRRSRGGEDHRRGKGEPKGEIGEERRAQTHPILYLRRAGGCGNLDGSKLNASTDGVFQL